MSGRVATHATATIQASAPAIAAPDDLPRLVAEGEADEQDVEIDEVAEAQAHLRRQLDLGPRVRNDQHEREQREIDRHLNIALPPAVKAETLDPVPPESGDDEQNEEGLVEEHPRKRHDKEKQNAAPR